jgi:TPR repeat protein
LVAGPAAAQAEAVDRWGLSEAFWNPLALGGKFDPSMLAGRQQEVEAAAAAGDAKALFLAATACFRAAWGPCDRTKAQGLLDQSAAAGNGLALTAQVALYGGSKDRPLPASYLARLNTAANNGSFPAMMVLTALAKGEMGGTRNPAQRLRWTKRLADAGERGAMFELGEMIEYGQGVPASVSQAMEWYRKAAEKGHVGAQHALGYCLAYCDAALRDYPQAMRWLKRASEGGSVNSLTTIGALHYDGLGVPVDRAEAVRWYERAAERGDIWAKKNLGLAYFGGNGVAKDPVRGARYFREAAEGGNALAMQRYGGALYYGEGVPMDRPAAIAWYRRAVAAGDQQAMTDLGSVYLIGDGVPKNYPEALRLLKLGALAGHSAALYNLGYMYQMGLGTPVNLAEAARNYAAAQSAGHPKAAGNLAIVREKQRLAVQGAAVRSGSAGAAPTAFDIRKALMQINATATFGGLTSHTMDFQSGSSRTTILGQQMEIRWTVTNPRCTRLAPTTFNCSYMLATQQYLFSSAAPLPVMPAVQHTDRLTWQDGYWTSDTMIARRRQAIAEQNARNAQRRAEDAEWLKTFCIGNPSFYKC